MSTSCWRTDMKKSYRIISAQAANDVHLISCLGKFPKEFVGSSEGESRTPRLQVSKLLKHAKAWCLLL